MSRKSISLLVSSSLIVAAAVACGHKIDRAKNDKAGTNTFTTKPKAGTGTESKPVADGAGSTATAGQPGFIMIGMAALRADGLPVDGLTATMVAGKDSAGKETTLKIQSKVIKKLSEGDDKALKDVKSLKNFINVGCLDEQLKDLSVAALTKEEAQKIEEDGAFTVTANTIAICGSVPNSLFSSFTADTILVSDASDLVRASKGSESLSFRANRVLVRGVNKFEVDETVAQEPMDRLTFIVNDKVDFLKMDAQIELKTIGSQAAKAAAKTAEQIAAQKAADAASKAAGNSVAK